MIKIDTAEGSVWINRAHVVSVREYGPVLEIITVGNRTYYDASMTVDSFLQQVEGNFL